MSEPSTPPTPVATATARSGGPAVIRIVHGAEESPHDRLMKKHLPAWVVSGAFHVVILVVCILVGAMRNTDAKPSNDPITAMVEEKAPDEQAKDLTNPDMGLDSTLKAAVEVDRVDELNVDAKVQTNEPVGVASDNPTPMDVPALAGIGALSDAGVAGVDGSALTGGGNQGTMAGKGFAGRSGATKEANLKAGGGNSGSELAVARGLAWLAKQQKAGGNWVYDGSSGANTIASTGMSLLPFLAAGQTHKKPMGPAQKDYSVNVKKGIDYLLSQQKDNGTFTHAQPEHTMYTHSIATIALCECYGMTGDKKLQYPCQRAINFLVQNQGNNGSWGYMPKTEGDTSIVGWAIQALKSGEMCKDLTVDKKSLKKATEFLDKVSDKSKKATYGYREPPGQPGTGLTAVGLLCRYYVDGWGPLHPGMSEGVKGLATRRPPNPNNFDMYYYYYATQVVHFHEGEVWHKDWNPKMRDMLINKQVGQDKKEAGSWDADQAMVGSSCGRLGTTCLALLTLEVYYRHLPLYKRDTGGMKELERGK